MKPPIVATPNPNLRARVMRCEPLFYREGPDPALDRPAHVRAGSGLTWLGRDLVVVQDDANFFGVIDLESWSARAVTLPACPRGKRLFGDDRGNKADKWDLECGVTIAHDGGRATVVALGSGSKPQRFHIVVVDFVDGEAQEIEVIDAGRFYEGLIGCTHFAGSELNLEGATFADGNRTLRLAQRGNGAPRAGLEPVNALCDIDWQVLWRHLKEPDSPVPGPTNVVQLELGHADGVALSFTELVDTSGGLFYLAAAEDSPNTVDDGPVVGVTLGIIKDAQAQFAHIVNEDGRPFLHKAEGLVLDPNDPMRAYAVTDRDDPELPSQLCELRLEGPWYV